MSKTIPKGVIRAWGQGSEEAFRFVIDELRERGFEEPRTWKHKFAVDFSISPCASIRVDVGLSLFSQESGIGQFASSIVVMSKTLQAKSTYRDPWTGGSAEDKDEHFLPCFVDGLGHRKWAQAPRATNPFWFMTLDSGVFPNVRHWLADFDQLHLPRIRALASDAVLVQEMKAALDYKKPEWVKSDGPHFVWMRERLAVLER